METMERLILAALLGATACKSDTPDEKAPDATPTKAEPAKQAGNDEPEAKASGAAGKMLEWLDPEAVTVMYVNLPPEIDAEVLSAVFAVPPKVAKMLRDARRVDDALDAVLDPESPRPDAWLNAEAIASSSVVSSGTYVLRTMTKPAAEVEEILVKSGMQKDEVEGMTLLMPQGPFPWKVAFLNDAVLGFIPVKEIGTGLSPLTAGRDMPASAVEKQLTQVLGNVPPPLLELYAAGPLLHLDLGQDVQQFELRLIPWQNKGMDAQLVLHPSRDATKAVATLGERDLELETDQVQALAGKVAFTVEGEAVTGRLQLTAEDVRALAGS